MELFIFIKGVLLGFSIAAPVGPIGVLCIRRTLTQGMLNGLISGLGAATADAFYGCIAAFGLTIISNFLLQQQLYLQIIGGVFLLYLGYTTFRSKPAAKARAAKNSGLIGAYISTVALTLTNPLTIMMFLAIFAGMGVGGTSDIVAGLLVFGIFVGSALWWLTLSGSVNLLRDKFNSNCLIWINRLSGLIILAFGLSSLLTL
ncbi:MAG TPA: LysE family transporter [Negativicutes bacterium]